MTHAKGPWEVSRDGARRDYAWINSKSHFHLAEVVWRTEGEVTSPDCEANARLIAAAPDMAEALRDLLEDYRFASSEWDRDARAQADLLIEKARAALAKAGL